MACGAPQEDLIGAEADGKHDEKRRAALHAAWLAQQDAAAVEQLMAGVKNGFRRKRNALDDEVLISSSVAFKTDEGDIGAVPEKCNVRIMTGPLLV